MDTVYKHVETEPQLMQTPSPFDATQYYQHPWETKASHQGLQSTNKRAASGADNQFTQNLLYSCCQDGEQQQKLV